MKTFLSRCIAVFGALFLWTEGYAQTHFSLDVQVDMEKRALLVSGTSDGPATLPDGRTIKADQAFSYRWNLPKAASPQTWRGGAFATDTELFLPANWHPVTKGHITFDVTLNAPMVTILPGQIHNEKVADSHYSARFVMKNPTEGIPLFGGPYKISELQNRPLSNPLRLRTYFYGDMGHLAKDYLHRTAKYIERFARQIGPFPFQQFHIIAAPLPAGYGFAGLTYMGKRVLHLPFIKESSLGHEILHNYWGNGVFPDYDSGNWAEGLTTYLADYMTAEQADPSKARDMRLSWLRDYNALPADQDKPVTRFVAKHGAASQVVGYHKVAFIFHMLRQQLGDQAFFAGLRQFWMSHAFQTASWQDVADSFNKISQQDLTPFFQQWLHTTGAPRFTSLSAQAKPDHDGTWHIQANVMQSNPPFNVQLPLRIGTGQGLVDQLVPVKGRLSQSSTTSKDRPVALSLDPDFNLFRKLGPTEVSPILRNVMLAPVVELQATSQNLQETAQKLATRMVEEKVLPVQNISLQQPFILIGQHDDVERILNQHRLPRPAFPDDVEASAHVWADKLDGQIPYIVMALKTPQNLADLLRPLPHYGKYAMLMFNAQRAVWKSTGQSHPMTVPIR